MVRLTLVVISLVVVSLMFMGISYAETWYEEDFDDFADGEIAGQDEWDTVMQHLDPNVVPLSSTIQGDVAFGDTGKSLLVIDGTMVGKIFPDDNAGIQHVSFHVRKDTETSRIMFYTGGGDIGWRGAAVLSIHESNINLTDDGVGVVDLPDIITLGEWSYFHTVLDFDSKTWYFYADGVQLADDIGFRSDAHESLDWMFIGMTTVLGSLVSYVDNISIGSGEGNPEYTPTAVSSSSKLATTWAELRR